MSKPLAVLSRQSEATWATFHRRVSSMSFDYSQLFPEPVFSFLDHQAKSLGSSIGSLVPSLLTCAAFLLASNDANLLLGTFMQLLNVYTMFVGHPGTGNSPTIETLLRILRDMDGIPKETLISSTTSSGLRVYVASLYEELRVLKLTKHRKALIASPEVYDVLNKLLKNDEENATGDVQLLCKLWSGEAAAYTFATESTTEIDANTPFSILGATQIQNSANIIYRMDEGHGLLDRFLVSVPLALKPTPKQEEDASQYLGALSFHGFGSIFAAIARAHKNTTRTYSLDPRAFDVHKRLKIEHVHQVNRAIQNGEVPPKSKGTDMVARVTVCLSTLHYFIYNLLKSEPCSDPSENITHSCYEKAMAYVDFLHSQKEMFAEFIKYIVQPAKEQTRGQPTALDIKTAILRFPGRLVTFQSFKRYSPRNLRPVQRQEFDQHVDDLKDFGTAVQIRVSRQARKIVVLIKKPVAEILPWPEHSPCSKDEYAQKF